MKHKLVSFATVIALWTLVNLLIKLIRMLLKWKYIHCKKLCHFGRYDAKTKLFCQKSFVPVTRLECSYGKIFIPVTEISVAKTEISVTGPARRSKLMTVYLFHIVEEKTQKSLFFCKFEDRLFTALCFPVFLFDR